MKAIRIILPDDQNFLFMPGDELHDPVTGIRLQVDKIFEDIDL